MGIKYSIRISIKYNLKYTRPSSNNSKMKFSFALLALAAAQDVAQDDTWYGAGASNSTVTAKQGQRSGQAVATDDTEADRRYDDLESIARHDWQEQVRRPQVLDLRLPLLPARRSPHVRDGQGSSRRCPRQQVQSIQGLPEVCPCQTRRPVHWRVRPLHMEVRFQVRRLRLQQR